jgi:predicted nucleic acid-binding protein
MALEQILIDSSFLYALYSPKNSQHISAKTIVTTIPAQFIIVPVVLTETAFLFQRQGGVPAVVRFIASFRLARMPFESVIYEDMQRLQEIMVQYADAKLDFVDCCLMAISERLKITKMCTFDRRDFTIFRPRHCDVLEILP